MKLIQSFVGLNNDWITQFSSVLIADTIHTFFVIVDALIQAYRKLAKMAKCSFCGLPSGGIYEDCIGHFGGNFDILCDWCTDINELLWQLAFLTNGVKI